MAVDRILCVFALTVIFSVAATSYFDESRIHKQEHCIPITPENEAEIQLIVDKVSDFVDNLAIDHSYFDVRLLKFAIDRHTPNEPEDKNVEIQVSVNDCLQTVNVTPKAGPNNAGAGNTNPSYAGTDNSGPSKAGTDKSGPSEAGTDTSDASDADTDTSEANDAGTDNSDPSDDAGTDTSKASDADTGTSGSSDACPGTSSPSDASNGNLGPSYSDTDNSGPDSAVKANSRPELINLDLDRQGQDLVDIIQKAKGNKPIAVYLYRGTNHIFLRK